MAKYKINIQKLVPFLYSNKELSEREVKKIPFTMASKRIKDLGLNLTKAMEDLYTKNCKTLMNKLKKTKINGKVSSAHELKGLIIKKSPYYPKKSTNSMQSLPKF